MNTELIFLAQIPTIIAIVGLIIRYENRLTRIETKIDILLPKKQEGGK